ncbi:MAG TPA: arsenite methyltransferase [Kofleriaceae bacterium]|jgi:ubiquinone/menaquinone biosynthesis C-methylase UbiE
MSEATADETRTNVREHYAKVSKGNASCAPGCCGAMPVDQSRMLGYSADDLAAVPEGADMGLGCGNPRAIASLRLGETVLDLGSGGGFDAFLAARAVGPTGRVIGVDMTPEMVVLARANARKVNATNVEFRLGEIEALPVADGTVDAILSNCVINLSPDKAAVFREAFRVLRIGGRLAISDVVAIAPIPPELQTQAAAIAGCIGGAAPIDDVRQMLTAAGFEMIKVTVAPRSAEIVSSWMAGADQFIASVTIEARRIEVKAACCPPGCCP